MKAQLKELPVKSAAVLKNVIGTELLATIVADEQLKEALLLLLQ